MSLFGNWVVGPRNYYYRRLLSTGSRFCISLIDQNVSQWPCVMFEIRVLYLKTQVFILFLELFLIPYRLFPIPEVSLSLEAWSALLIQVNYLMKLDM